MTSKVFIKSMHLSESLNLASWQYMLWVLMDNGNLDIYGVTHQRQFALLHSVCVKKILVHPSSLIVDSLCRCVQCFLWLMSLFKIVQMKLCCISVWACWIKKKNNLWAWHFLWLIRHFINKLIIISILMYKSFYFGCCNDFSNNCIFQERKVDHWVSTCCFVG